MANKYSQGYEAAYVTVPYTPFTPGHHLGRLRGLYGKYDIGDDAAVIATADTIYYFKIPKGFLCVGGTFKFDDAGNSTGTAQIGWDADAGAVETADPDGFWSAIDINSAQDQLLMALDDADNAGLFHTFLAEVNCVLTCTTATDVTVDGNLEVLLMGLLD